MATKRPYAHIRVSCRLNAVHPSFHLLDTLNCSALQARHSNAL